MLRQAVAEEDQRMGSQRQPEEMTIQIQRCEGNCTGNLANPAGSLETSIMLRQVIADQDLKTRNQRQPEPMRTQMQRYKGNLAGSPTDPFDPFKKCSMLPGAMRIQRQICKANWAGNLGNPTGFPATSSILRQVVA
jgi:hypothetical protein